MSLDPRLAKKLDDCASTLARVCRDKQAPGKRFVAELKERCDKARVLNVRFGEVIHPVKVADIRVSRATITLGDINLCAIGIGRMVVDEDPTSDEETGRVVYAVRDAWDKDVPLELVAA